VRLAQVGKETATYVGLFAHMCTTAAAQHAVSQVVSPATAAGAPWQLCYIGTVCVRRIPMPAQLPPVLQPTECVQLLLATWMFQTSCLKHHPHCTCRGTGGRQAAKDPRLDPAIDAKKARQILNNRKNAAISQLRKKIAGLVRQGRWGWWLW
jgi:hypothetical protein